MKLKSDSFYTINVLIYNLLNVNHYKEYQVIRELIYPFKIKKRKKIALNVKLKC